MQAKIKAISIHAFRGIPDLEIELDGKNLLIGGENGTGKSSIVDAVEFFFRGTLPNFEGKGAQALSLHRDIPHKDFKDDDVSIRIVFNPRTISLLRTFREPPIPSKQFDEYFKVAQRGNFILRRSQILKFIVCSPADRYKAIASILGLEQLDDVELALKHARDQLEGHLKSIENQKGEIYDEISKLVNEKITNNDDILLSLNKRAQEVNVPVIKSLDELKGLSENMLEHMTTAKDPALLTELEGIQEHLSNPIIDDKFIEQLKRFYDSVLSFLQDSTKLKELTKGELLERGKRPLKRVIMVSAHSASSISTGQNY